MTNQKIIAGVVIEQAGKYLLVQEKKPSAYGLWNLPAGKVEDGLSIEETAINEAKEETNYDVELLRKLGVFTCEADPTPKHAFAAKIIGGILQIPGDELLDARWVTYDESQKMNMRDPWVMEAINTFRLGGETGLEKR